MLNSYPSKLHYITEHKLNCYIVIYLLTQAILLWAGHEKWRRVRTMKFTVVDADKQYIVVPYDALKSRITLLWICEFIDFHICCSS